jgi:hypothetical protein
MDDKQTHKVKSNLFLEYIGWSGAILLLLAYFLIQVGLINSQNYVYIILNIIGALFLVIHTWAYKAYLSVVTNLVWAIIAIGTLSILVVKNKNS